MKIISYSITLIICSINILPTSGSNDFRFRLCTYIEAKSRYNYKTNIGRVKDKQEVSCDVIS